MILNRILFLLVFCSSITFAADPPPPRSGAASPPQPPSASPGSTGAGAAGNPASEASIKELLEITHARKLLDTMMSQMDDVMKNAMQQATQGQPPPPEAQKTFDKCRSEVITAMQQQFTWDKLEPMYMRIYQKSFNQSEVNGMIEFYKTPVGQAVINKMPVVMQNSMNEVMQMMGPMMQRIERMQKDVVAQLQTKKSKKEG
jgi:hypothetical protein